MPIEPRGIVVVIDQESQLLPLLSGGHRLATIRDEPLVLMVLNETESVPGWLNIPAEYDQSRISIQVIPTQKAVSRFTGFLRHQPPTLVVFGMGEGERDLVRDDLAPLLQRVKCPVALIRTTSKFKPDAGRTELLVPFWNDDNSRFALRTALSMNPNAIVTAAMVVPETMEDADRVGRERELSAALSEWAQEERVVPKLLIASNPADALVAEAAQHDTIVMGVSQGFVFLRAVTGDASSIEFNDVQRSLIERTPKPVIVLREYQGWLGVLLSRVFMKGNQLLPTLEAEERIEVYQQIRRAARPTQNFFIMIASSAAIASIGLIMNSPAVIIGAMLIAPLMSAIIGMGLAIAQGDFRFLASASKATLRGVSIAALAGFAMGLVNLGAEPTAEMLARSEPTLLDFLVATVSGFAAAYALCRKDISAALPGVAIAVALVPPLAAMGLFAGMNIFSGAYGALLLFLTNLAAITFASGIVFTLLGFRPPPTKTGDTKRYKAFQQGFLVTGLLVLAVFSNLTVLSVGEIEESDEEKMVHSLLTKYATEFSVDSHLIHWTATEDDRGQLHVTGTIASAKDIDPARLPKLVNDLEVALRKPIELTLSQFPTITAKSKNWSKQKQ